MFGKIAVLLTLAVLLSGLSACTSLPESAEAATSAESEAAETDYLERFAGQDFEGGEFHIIAQSVPGEQPTVPNTELTGETVLDALFERDRTIQEKYNVALVYTHEKYNKVESRAQLHSDLTAAILANDWPVAVCDHFPCGQHQQARYRRFCAGPYRQSRLAARPALVEPVSV